VPELADLLVIGAGAAGIEAALTAARLGRSVALVHVGELGGTCVNSGCLPSGALLRSAQAYHERRAGDGTLLDLAAAHGSAGKIAERVQGGIRHELAAHRVRVIEGFATLRDRSTAVVTSPGGELTLAVSEVIIATGATTTLPPVAPIHSRVYTSADMLSLSRVPPSAIVVIGGHLGLEWATFLRNAGSRVVVVEERPVLRAVADAEVSEYFAAQLECADLTILTETAVMAVDVGTDDVVMTLRSATGTFERTAKAAVFADFRRPNSISLGLEQLGIDLGSDGEIVVDDKLSTEVPGVWAAGDVTGGLMLAAEARVQGRIAAENACGGSSAFNRSLVPRALHTDPAAASVGLTEAEARTVKPDVSVGYAEYAANPGALIRGSESGVVKLIVDLSTDEILGAAVVGDSAGEIVSMVSLAMQTELTVHDLVNSNHPHPAILELLIDAGRAALSEG
jgi:dihydrolipoamide dehydrogenase